MNEAQQKISVQIVNAFVKDGSGGNPAGVVLDADGLSDAAMLKIAQQVGLSETAFVSRSETEGFKLDFFTPTRRIAHCGHATVATFSYLASLNRVGEGETSKETVDGPRKIVLKDGAAYMGQLAPSYKPVAKDEVLASLSLSSSDLDERLEPILVNTGNNFIVLAVRDDAVLKNLKPDFDMIEKISNDYDLIGYYVFVGKEGDQGVDATARMFAPRYGITEEAATGMAAGPLACVLYDHLDVKKDTLVIEQGHFMDTPSPSRITVELDLKDGQIQGLLAGGLGKVMQAMEVSV